MRALLTIREFKGYCDIFVSVFVFIANESPLSFLYLFFLFEIKLHIFFPLARNLLLAENGANWCEKKNLCRRSVSKFRNIVDVSLFSLYQTASPSLVYSYEYPTRICILITPRFLFLSFIPNWQHSIYPERHSNFSPEPSFPHSFNTNKYIIPILMISPPTRQPRWSRGEKN